MSIVVRLDDEVIARGDKVDVTELGDVVVDGNHVASHNCEEALWSRPESRYFAHGHISITVEEVS